MGRTLRDSQPFGRFGIPLGSHESGRDPLELRATRRECGLRLPAQRQPGLHRVRADQRLPEPRRHRQPHGRLQRTEGTESEGQRQHRHQTVPAEPHRHVQPIGTSHGRLRADDHAEWKTQLFGRRRGERREIPHVQPTLPQRSAFHRGREAPLLRQRGGKLAVEQLLADRLFEVQVNIQMHKYVWPDAKTEV